MAALVEFIQARNFLWSHRTDYATAYRDFHCSKLDRFHWALDYFDQLALGSDKTAL